ncbi:MAG: ATP-dependent DNA helicase RecQ [Bacteroidia bacterium]|nr:MAG: ATP-dependent DNA helicase RecQ [Bacteroidia bacterium]
MKEKIYQILQQYWKYNSFRPLQEEIILSVLSGKDTIALLPTGGGKSVCFQVPGMAIENGMTLVISPLIALMQDQVMNLKRRGISAAFVNSTMHPKEVEKVIQNAIDNEYKFLYVSPERLETASFVEILPDLKVGLLAVDEAHCISQWGYDFRPSYLKIAEIRKHLYNPNIPTIALTASATEKVIDDITDRLELKSPNIFKQSFARKNLHYIVLYETNKIDRIQRIIHKVGGAGIIYVRSRNKTKEIADVLNNKGIRSDYYHAGLSGEEKYFKQQKFIENEYQVMVATNAFGMGIDKPDVRFVIHYELSDSIESYFQEAGRGGRDLKTAYAVLLYSEADKEKLWRMYEESFPAIEQIKSVYNHLCNYYELAIDEGEGMMFDFDIRAISELYKIPMNLLFHSVKFLEMFELITIEDEHYHPSQVFIELSKRDIYDFYLRHPEYEEIIKVLLRSYDGILSQFVYINESEIAARIKRDKKFVVEQLKFLDKEGILYYRPMTGLPKITFLKDRILLSKLKLNEELYYFLKERRKFLTEKMIEYAEQKHTCRQEFLLHYFDELNTESCGHCDVCLEKKRLKNIETIKDKLFEFFQHYNQSMSIEEICNQFSQYSKDLVIQAIREMIDDNLLRCDEKDRVFLN